MTIIYLVSFDEHETHDEVFSDVLRLREADALHQPSLLLLTVLQKLKEPQWSLEGRTPGLRQAVDAANPSTKHVYTHIRQAGQKKLQTLSNSKLPRKTSDCLLRRFNESFFKTILRSTIAPLISELRTEAVMNSLSGYLKFN